jgi:hypothetical protein
MKKILLALMVVALAGCTTNRGLDFTVISTKNIDLSRMGEYKKTADRAVGEDTLHVIIGIPLGSQPNMEEAIDKAIESVPGGVALTDGVITNSSMFLYLYAKASIIVEGSVLYDPEVAKVSGIEMGKYNVVVFDTEGNISKIESVTEDEFKKLSVKS